MAPLWRLVIDIPSGDQLYSASLAGLKRSAKISATGKVR
ncbi:hypothetical protein P775_24905 [Puniceibacterium antarcticum]|uniref:Uncharacterized protein n=1 Tax=Puniceibacterium antarcticum TaxID=1206336 RepID=A0A2G8R6J7_9RHOB|nr:hypothetical protein P775_24905 [Puniceibacterium antarcticum]